MRFPPADVLIIGSGVAGLRAAIAAADAGVRPVLIAGPGGASSRALADLTACGDHLQALGYAGSPDPPEALAADLQLASFGLADPARTMTYACEAGPRLEELLSWGASPARQLDQRSIVIPGATIIRTLRRQLQLRAHDQIEHWHVAGLMQVGAAVGGAWLGNSDGALEPISARAIVLATGGYHGITHRSTAEGTATGHGHAWALRAGATLVDLEMINYCPHVIAGGPQRGSILPYLVSQLLPVRLLDRTGTDLIEELGSDSHCDGEWDKLGVTLAMARATAVGRAYPDGSYLFQLNRSDRRFLLGLAKLWSVKTPRPPAEWALFQRLLLGERIPVCFAAHYSGGGIVASSEGATAVPGLFACGEVAGGTFGACRVASSITDCLVSGASAGRAAALYAMDNPSPRTPTNSAPRLQEPKMGAHQPLTGRALAPPRCEQELAAALEQVALLAKAHPHSGQVGTSAVGADSLLIARAVLMATLARQDSRGFHLRAEATGDQPQDAQNTRVRLIGDELHCTRAFHAEVAPKGV